MKNENNTKKESRYTFCKNADKAWKKFWLKRGYICPPSVSSDTLGLFDLPNKIKEQDEV